MSIGAVILAAGFSRRLGRPKQKVVLGGETLLDRAVRTAQEAGLAAVIAVLREAHAAAGLNALGATPLINEHAHEGMATSVVTGVRWAMAHGLSGVVVMTCDQPALHSDHLRALCADPQHTTASHYGGRNGVPAYFPSSTFNELLTLEGDTGARGLLKNASAIQNESLALDIDTEADLLKAQQLFSALNH